MYKDHVDKYEGYVSCVKLSSRKLKDKVKVNEVHQVIISS